MSNQTKLIFDCLGGVALCFFVLAIPFVILLKMLEFIGVIKILVHL